MYEFEQLEENEIRQYPELHGAGGIGEDVKKAMSDYTRRLAFIKGKDFHECDTSSTKDVVSELIRQMRTISESMDEVDFMIDNLFHIIRSGVLDEEDKIAENTEV